MHRKTLSESRQHTTIIHSIQRSHTGNHHTAAAAALHTRHNHPTLAVNTAPQQQHRGCTGNQKKIKELQHMHPHNSGKKTRRNYKQKTKTVTHTHRDFFLSFSYQVWCEFAPTHHCTCMAQRRQRTARLAVEQTQHWPDTWTGHAARPSPSSKRPCAVRGRPIVGGGSWRLAALFTSHAEQQHEPS